MHANLTLNQLENARMKKLRVYYKNQDFCKTQKQSLNTFIFEIAPSSLPLSLFFYIITTI